MASTQTLPKEFLDRLARMLPVSECEAIVQTFAQPKPTTFRVNTLRASVESVRAELEGAGFHLEPVSWYPEACILRQGDLPRLQETEAYRTGALYVQSLSSMIPALVLNPQPGDTVLDVTAAPGSKTTQMAALMRNEGRLVANDNNRLRFYKLKANVKLQGASNVELSLRYGESFGRLHPGEFDRVLVDAPCTTEGRFYLPKPTSYRHWKVRKIHEMSHKQKKLLAAGIHALKPGGVLVYSTCTFGPEENEAVVSWALEKFGEAVALEPIHLPSVIPNVMPGLSSWNEQSYHSDIRHAVRILPTSLMEGFFLAKIRKVAFDMIDPPSDPRLLKKLQAGHQDAAQLRGRWVG